MEKKLKSLNFTFCPQEIVVLGTKHPLHCLLEVTRRNETPVHYDSEEGLWINRYCVTNGEYERFQSKHKRPTTSPGPMHPVTDITYREAISYIEWLSKKEKLPFDLPTEPQWILAAGPTGWEYPYQKKGRPDKSKAHTFNPNCNHTLPVDSDLFPPNHLGLLHIGGNVMEMTKGWYYSLGHQGYATDGAYFIAKGGNYGHCPYSARINTRVLFDVSNRSTRVGLRLICKNK